MTEKLTTTAAKKARKAAKAGGKAAPKAAPKAVPGTPPKIVEAKSTVNGSHLVVSADNGEKFTIRSGLVGDKAFAAMAAVGKDYRKAEAKAKELTEAAKAPGHLAKGVDSRNSPHSAKSVADRKAKERPLTKAAQNDHRAIKEAKARKAKAERAAKAAPKADDDRKITVVDKKFAYGKEGTSRRASWDACTKSKTVAEYAAKGGALKYLPRWTAAGAIKLG